jgi:hypothetical protein
VKATGVNAYQLINKDLRNGPVTVVTTVESGVVESTLVVDTPGTWIVQQANDEVHRIADQVFRTLYVTS